LLTENRLWQLSLALYQQPGIEPLCLQAQHEQGAEVNLLLLLALLQAQGMSVDYKPLRYAAAPLQPALQQWRLSRRALKGKLDADRYAALLSHELMLERQLQQTLLTALPRAQRSGASRTPLNDYLESIGPESIGLESIGAGSSQPLAQRLVSQAQIILNGRQLLATDSPLTTEELAC
jgi:uncharacterized protein (TIGR02444 family)